MVQRTVVFILSIALLLSFTMVSHNKKQWPKQIYTADVVQQDSMCILLGRALFYDPILSRDSTISCSSCHSSYVAFTHVDHAVSHGIEDRMGKRNAPALMNLAWSSSFMWDGAINHLDMQPLAPITSTSEMDEHLPDVMAKLNRSRMYKTLFYQVFGDSSIPTERMLKSFSAFLLTLVSRNSKYDEVMNGRSVFTEQEVRGYEIFKAQCNVCHTEPLFTNGAFRSNGIAPLRNDYGRVVISGNSADSGLFKVPTLRNIYYSRPYMHDGRYRSLSEVLKHYTSRNFSSYSSEEMSELELLSEAERIDLQSFLLTLSDSSFVFEKGFQYPVELFDFFTNGN